MNKKIYLLLSVLLAWSFNLKAQTAVIGDTTATPGDNDVTFDLTVAGFPANVGAISLFIGYDPNVLTYTGTTGGTITGFITNNMVGTNQVGIQWTNPSGGQAIDGVLLTLHFDYNGLGGECDITFNPGCEFADIDLNTIPVGYTGGHIGPTAGTASLTIQDVPSTAGATPVLITAANFPANVGAITLFITYDPSVASFVNTTPGTLTSYFSNANNGVIGITWSNAGGAAINGTLLTLNFMYSNGTSPLNFTGGCEIVENDFDPIITSFNSGSLFPAVQDQSMTLEDEVGIPGNTVGIDITAAGYDFNFDVAAITLYIGYDPASLTFVNTNSGTISGAYANVISPGLLGITWTDSNGDDIDGVLLTLNFIYNIGQCDVIFEGGCEIADEALNVIPTSFYDGSISQGYTLATAEILRKYGVIGQPISFPILVSNFPTDVAAISLYIGFNSSVLQYTGTTDGTITGYFANYVNTWSAVGIQWTDPSGTTNISPNPGDTLLTLNFIYLGGYSDVKFNSGCEFADINLDPVPVSYFNGAVITGTKLDVKAFLGGPFDPDNLEMFTTLNDSSFIPLSQPYDSIPWNYAGTEAVGSIPADVVDWVLLELRETTGTASTADSSTIIGTAACFILKDGTVVGLDGLNEVLYNLAINDDLYVVIYHRNHLAIMSANALTFTNINGYDVYTYDFTDGQSKAYDTGTTYGGQGALAGGKFGMYAGDADGNGDINFTDIDTWIIEAGTGYSYFMSDFDLNSDVNFTDLDYWIYNSGNLTQVPDLLP
jgi:hypothetical protein